MNYAMVARAIRKERLALWGDGRRPMDYPNSRELFNEVLYRVSKARHEEMTTLHLLGMGYPPSLPIRWGWMGDSYGSVTIGRARFSFSACGESSARQVLITTPDRPSVRHGAAVVTYHTHKWMAVFGILAEYYINDMIA